MGMSKNYPKKIRKKIRDLAEIAYAQEMKNNLQALSLKFDEWKRGQITNDDLNQSIHIYHDKTSRESWKAYQYSDDDIFVVRAILHKFLLREEIADDVYDALKDRLELFTRSQNNDRDES